MAKYRITYYEMAYGAPMFSMPRDIYNSEVVETDDIEKVHEHIMSIPRKDHYGAVEYKRADVDTVKMLGFDYTSHNGGIKIEEIETETVIPL